MDYSYSTAKGNVNNPLKIINNHAETSSGIDNFPYHHLKVFTFPYLSVGLYY